MAEYRQGTGPNRLPQGGAAQASAATPPAAAFEATDPNAPGSEVPVMYAPEVEDEDPGPLTESMDVLLSPPDPDYRASAVPKDRQGRVPRYVVRHLPQLMAAARDPDAPPAVRAIYNAVARQLEMEQRRGG